MEVKVKQIDKFKFNIKASSHAVISDQPTENGGEDEGMTPPELMLASLGARSYMRCSTCRRAS